MQSIMMDKKRLFRNQEQFVRRLINAQSHFATQGMDDRIESRDKLIQLKTQSKKF